MSDETQGRQTRPARPGEGAALSAPTSPHATPPLPGAKRRKSGPERFWTRRRVTLATLVSLFLSMSLHYAFSPWSLLPLYLPEVKDTDGELSIPIDLLEGDEAPTPPPPPPPAETPPAIAPPAVDGPGPGAVVADASAPHPRPDAGARDAGTDADEPTDAGRMANGTGPSDAASDALLATGPAGEGLVGEGGIEGVTAGEKLVEVRVNMAVVKSNPVGARMAPLLRAIPQWEEFMSGTDVDPIADVDWVRIYGPSLIRTEKDAVIVHFNMADARAAREIAALSKHDVSGGAYDAGVPGVKAWRGHADRAARVFMIPRSHVAVMVPPEKAHETARVFSKIDPHLNMKSGEAVWVMVKNPSHPMPFLPTSLTEMRVRVVPRADGSADAFAEADATDETAARTASRQVRGFVQQMNSLGVKLMTRGLLNDVEVGSDGPRVLLHLVASRDQLEALFDLVSAYLGVDSPPSEAPSATPAPSARPR